VAKFKKAFMCLALVGGSSWGLFAPAVASAGFFSIATILSSIIPQASAQSESFNSQTVPILAPATNLDPNPSVGGGDIHVVDGSALVPQDGPSGTSADIGARPVSYSISVYTVREGDTLSGIAHMFGVTVGTITGANELQGKPIHPGQELVILPITGVRYTVKAGDTIAGIAKDMKSDAYDIRQYNDLGSDADLVAGASILIPNVETSVATPAAAKSPSVAKKAAAPAKSATPAKKPEPGASGTGLALSGYFGLPVHGIITQSIHGYNGIDIGAPNGTPVYAAAGGTVIVAKTGGYNGGYGSYVVIRHPNGAQTLYAHMSSVLTTVGATVTQGANIGRVGSTGESTGNHLHFEVRGATNPLGAYGEGARI
jgi:murein DD-endopeptidase MepM/ murein hydrolase activator NlpD